MSSSSTDPPERAASAAARTAAATDHDLVAAAVAGHRAALDELLRRHQTRMYGVCLRMTGNEADARDATQEAMLAVCRGLPRFDGRSVFSTWVYRVTTNACLDELRRRNRRPIAHGSGDDLIGPGPRAADGAAVTPGATTQRAADDAVVARLTLDEALAHLPDDFRAALVLRDLCELDYAEIADVLGIPPGTVRSRIARARAALARHLAPTDGAPVGNQQVATDRPIERP